MKKLQVLFIIFLLFRNFSFAQSVPNIVIILSDDQGYADVSYNPEHSVEISTPNIDSLAHEGVVFNQAYTSGSVCSPTRAGLMLGRYQARVGVFENNSRGDSFDPSVPIFPSFLPEQYTSSVIGKWHLGLDHDAPELKWHALNRGFDECYYFMGKGGHDYFNIKDSGNVRYAPIYRNKSKLSESEFEGYMTTNLTKEAVEFIEREKSNPFFLYLAYNAVHSPPQAPEEDLNYFRKKYPGLSNGRITLLAMLRHMDNGVGEIVKKLKDENLWDNTILFFLTDNGGSLLMEADNGKLRDFKGSLFEGGIRTPFIVSWPAEFEGGKNIDIPIISIDILPTVLDAIGVDYNEADFDGKSILPLICGGAVTHHKELIWDMRGESDYWAVRRENMKVISKNGKIQVYNLLEDPSETTDLSDKYKSQMEKMKNRHNRWLIEMKNTESTLKYVPQSTSSKDGDDD